MARPRKTELDYFPFDVVFFEDMKLFELNDIYGPLGEVIYLRLLCLIYKSKEGYFLEKDIGTIALIILKSIGTKWGRSKKFVAQVISQLAEFGLIDKSLLHDGIITSAGIQRRYLKATERRQTNIEKYCLLSDEEMEDIRTSCCKNTAENGLNVAETRVNVAETRVNATLMPQSKSERLNIKKNNEVSKKEDINNSACAPARGLESYQSILDSFKVKEITQYYYFEFIKHCQLNGRMVTNDKLRNLILTLDKHYQKEVDKIDSLKAAINGGYFDIAENH